MHDLAVLDYLNIFFALLTLLRLRLFSLACLVTTITSPKQPGFSIHTPPTASLTMELYSLTCLFIISSSLKAMLRITCKLFRGYDINSLQVMLHLTCKLLRV